MSERNPFDGILLLGVALGVIGSLLLAALIGLTWWVCHHVQFVP